MAPKRLIHSLAYKFTNDPIEYQENPMDYQLHPVAKLAIEDLQQYLLHQNDFQYNFGWENDGSVGKMFGVLVVKHEGKLGYIAAYSGKIFDHFNIDCFVPPIYNMFDKSSFYKKGEQLTKSLNVRYNAALEECKSKPNHELQQELLNIKKERQNISHHLQQQLFDAYKICNKHKAYKTVAEIFETLPILPKAGTGDCSAIRLFQYAFENDLQPIALGEFWWGADTPSKSRVHLQTYTACVEKCAPLLSYMLT